MYSTSHRFQQMIHCQARKESRQHSGPPTPTHKQAENTPSVWRCSCQRNPEPNWLYHGNHQTLRHIQYTHLLDCVRIPSLFSDPSLKTYSSIAWETLTDVSWRLSAWTRKSSSGGFRGLMYRVMKTVFPLMSITVVRHWRPGNLSAQSAWYVSAAWRSCSSSWVSNLGGKQVKCMWFCLWILPPTTTSPLHE